jgi:hypothetical protein
MKILVGCEFSGIVRDAFINRGHQAVSVDLLPSERPGPHVIADIRSMLTSKWDMLIVFPPCTYLCRSGAQHHYDTPQMHRALDFVFTLLEAPIKRIALENPIGAINTWLEKPTQIVQPWWFGEPETKATCLWLDNLPKLVPTNPVKPTETRVHYEPPGPNRWKNRSRTLPGLAQAMADQWSGL